MLYDDTTVSPCVVYNLPRHIESYYVFGYSNGVICLLDYNSRNFHFWNPLFNKSMNHKIEFKLMWSLCFGFGYDSKSNYFKFVHVFHDEERDQVFAKLYAISGTGNTTWRIYSITPPQGLRYYVDKYSVVYVNGALHWLASRRVHGDDETDRNHILSFNVEDEVFREFDLPEPVNQWYYNNPGEPLTSIKITEFNGMLCLFPRWFDLPCVWVMKEYGKAESWVPLVNITSSRITKFCEVVDLKDDEEEKFWVLQKHNGPHWVFRKNPDPDRLCVFNPKTRKLKKRRRISGGDCFFRGRFMESFALMDD